MTSREVVEILIARPVILAYTALYKQPGCKVVLKGQVAKKAIAADVLELFSDRPIRVGAVSEAGVNKFVARRIVFFLIQKTQRHGIGQVVERGRDGVVLVGNVGWILVVFVGIIDVSGKTEFAGQVVSKAQVDGFAVKLVVADDPLVVHIGKRQVETSFVGGRRERDCIGEV